jgi:hypothetical protein
LGNQEVNIKRLQALEFGVGIPRKVPDAQYDVLVILAD